MEEAKLTDFRKKIENGKAPMPLMTCLHVRPKTSAMTFHGMSKLTFSFGNNSSNTDLKACALNVLTLYSFV